MSLACYKRVPNIGKMGLMGLCLNIGLPFNGYCCQYVAQTDRPLAPCRGAFVWHVGCRAVP
jgi:hypothetical protein